MANDGWEDISASNDGWEDVAPTASATKATPFKSGSAFEETGKLIPSMDDIKSTWQTLQDQWANRHNTPMTTDDMQKMVADEHAAGSGVLDTVGALPAMVIGAGSGIYHGIKDWDATSGLKAANETMGKYLPSTLLGNKADQELGGYKTTQAPFTALMDTVNAIPQGFGEILNAAGAPKAAAQVTDAGKLGLMAAMGFEGTKGMLPEKGRPANEPRPNIDPAVRDLGKQGNLWEDVVPEGQATPYNPNRLSSDVVEPIPTQTNPKFNQDLQFDHPDAIAIDSNGVPIKDAADLGMQAGRRDYETSRPVDQRQMDMFPEGAMEPRPQETAAPARDLLGMAEEPKFDQGTRPIDSSTGKPMTGMDASIPTVDFPLRSEVLNGDPRVQELRQQVQGAQDAVEAVKARNGSPEEVAKASQVVEHLTDRFGAYMDDAYGMKQGSDAYKPLIETGGPTKLPIQSTHTPKMGKFGRQGGSINAGEISAGFKGIMDSIRNLLPEPHSDIPAISSIVGKNRIPADPHPQDVITKALSEGKDTNAWGITKETASGATLEGMTRRSALIQGVSRIVQNAQKRADLYIQKTVFPVEKQFRQMSVKDITSLASVFKDEAVGMNKFSVEQLEQQGLNEKQLRAYAGVRKLFENALEVQNTQRRNLGLPEIDGKEYYSASRWRGDFRQPVYENTSSGKKLVWYLAADTKFGLDKQAKALLKQSPDLIIDPKNAHTSRSGVGRSDLQAMYTSMLDVLGRDDPAVARIKQAYEDAMATESSTMLGQPKHAEDKANIRGFVGDRPGVRPSTDALDMFQEQIQYAKNAYKWASMQEAGAGLKEILSNEQLRDQQPKNVEFAQEYYKNNLGHGTAQWVSAFEDALKSTGISPKVFDHSIGGLKSFFITQKLAGSAGYTIANLLQTFNSIPHLVDILVKNGGNPAKALSLGLATGAGMAAGHHLNAMGGDFSRVLGGSKFLDNAFRYAEDNGVTSRSVYDESPIDARGPVNAALRVAGKTMTIPESFVRSASYMSFVHMLADTGKFANEHEIFQKAEELTNATMVDYRTGERPMGFAKAGMVGNALNTLQTFPMNLYNQYRYFAKEAAAGNPAPLMAMIALQYGMAGAMGMPGFSDLDTLFGWIKGKLPDNVYAKVRDFDPKLWMLENLGEASVYGALSTATGVSMTSRLTAPGLSDMAVSPAAPLMDTAKQVGSVVNAAINPNSTTLAQAAHDVAPTGLQGYLETGPFKDENSIARKDGTTLYKKSTDLAARQGQYVRTPEEETMRAFSLRSQREALSNDLTYKEAQMEKEVSDRSKSLVDKFYDAVRRGDVEKSGDIQKLYTQLNGTAINNPAIESQILDEYTTKLEKKSVSATVKLQAIKGVARMQKIMKERDSQ